ncbi:MAG: 50S ribosomal protein L29 [bacterium]
MEILELKNKPEAELKRLLALTREKLRDIRFKDANKQLKNVQAIREAKKTIARILTLVNSNK